MGLTILGIIHTAISLVALASGALALIRDGKISWATGGGKTYVITTALTCLTAFGIYQHGGFGPGHVLAIITLVVLTLALVAGMNSKPFGGLSPYIETVGYSATFFFHLIPGLTEASTRLPADAPLASGPGDPNLKLALGITFLLFVVGATWQVLNLRAGSKKRD